ncbi:hypothetical protein MXB_3790 [Myxobolus squamalis]|nr:hypothetical protein MXB_3790 [Myxobolus squamalis]
MTVRTEYMYCSILHELIVLIQYNYIMSFSPNDFKKEFLAAVEHEIVVCHFHFTQAFWCKATKYGIVDDELRK